MSKFKISKEDERITDSAIRKIKDKSKNLSSRSRPRTGIRLPRPSLQYEGMPIERVPEPTMYYGTPARIPDLITVADTGPDAVYLGSTLDLSQAPEVNVRRLTREQYDRECQMVTILQTSLMFPEYIARYIVVQLMSNHEVHHFGAPLVSLNGQINAMAIRRNIINNSDETIEFRVPIEQVLTWGDMYPRINFPVDWDRYPAYSV